METTEAITITILGVGLLVLCMLLAAVWRVGGCLLRLERRLAEQGDLALAAKAANNLLPLPAEPPADGAFAEFLAEDPQRRDLPKREQAETYRRWRRNRGLNWSAP